MYPKRDDLLAKSRGDFYHTGMCVQKKNHKFFMFSCCMAIREESKYHRSISPKKVTEMRLMT